MTKNSELTPTPSLLVEVVDHGREQVTFMFTAVADGTEYVIDLFDGELFVDQASADPDAQFREVSGRYRVPVGSVDGVPELFIYDEECEAQYNARPVEERNEIVHILNTRFVLDADGGFEVRK